MRALARVDLAAIARNLGHVMDVAAPAQVMAVVKADAYGHGIVPVAHTARDAGAIWLGVAYPSEALTLRAIGDVGRILAWLWLPGDVDVAACVDQDVDLGVSSMQQLDFLVSVAPTRARVHLKVDTGLGRSGAALASWDALVAAARVAQKAGKIELVGVWSHLASGELPNDASVVAQREAFETASASLADLDLLRHLANSGATLANPDTRFDLVRTGIAMYGLNPGYGRPAVTPAMSLHSEVALTKRVPAGHGVSYGHTWRAEAPTGLALIPMGYGDGIPRNAAGTVLIGERRYPIVGRVAMDQFVVMTGDDEVNIGDPVEVFGPGPYTADNFAAACGTIGYEIVTRISGRVSREYVS